MSNVSVIFKDDPTAAELEQLGRGLTVHARPFVPGDGFRSMAIFSYGAGGSLQAGIAANHNWNWLHITLLWVDEALRGQGIGGHLLDAMEQAGRERGCAYAHLDTFSYQAKPLYEARGYTVFGQLDDYPPGHSRYFLRKDL